MKFHSAAANGLETGTFQKCNRGQIDPMVDRGLILFQIFGSWTTDMKKKHPSH